MCVTHISLESNQTLHHINFALFRRLQRTPALFPNFLFLFHIFQKYEQITPILPFCTASREHVSYSPEKNPKR